MILPVGAKDFDEAMQMGTETYHGTSWSCAENERS